MWGTLEKNITKRFMEGNGQVKPLNCLDKNIQYIELANLIFLKILQERNSNAIPSTDQILMQFNFNREFLSKLFCAFNFLQEYKLINKIMGGH